MTGLSLQGDQLTKLHANPPGVKPVPARAVRPILGSETPWSGTKLSWFI